MQPVDYDVISKVYDDVRSGDVELINLILSELANGDSFRILDFGCGTGNYTRLLKGHFHGQVYGVDPSEGMLEKARLKAPEVDFRQGSADALPFENSFFNLVYMTDVIHHVPDIGRMFAEIHRVLAPDGKVCVVTQSHAQIEARPIARFFPGTIRVDKARYPDINDVIVAARGQGLDFIRHDLWSEAPWIELGPVYLELVRKKGYSMLHLIAEQEYLAGLKELARALQNGPIKVKPAGGTLIWFIKSMY